MSARATPAKVAAQRSNEIVLENIATGWHGGAHVLGQR